MAASKGGHESALALEAKKQNCGTFDMDQGPLQAACCRGLFLWRVAVPALVPLRRTGDWQWLEGGPIAT